MAPQLGWAVVPLLMTALFAVATAARASSEISQSAIITSLYDIEHPEVDGKLTRCESIVQKSKATGAKNMGIVLTIAAQGSEKSVGFYQYQDGMGGYVAVSKDSISRWRKGLEKCFRMAVQSGFTKIHLLPHIDVYEVNKAGKQSNSLWRNIVRFDPLVKHGTAPAAFSYEDMLLTPAVEALKAVLTPAVTVEFALAGEQGLSVFGYPRSWEVLLERTRTALANHGSRKHTYGVSFNWNKVCGCVEPRERDPLIYNRTYTQRLARWRADKTGDKLMGPSVIDVQGAKRLLQKSDFVGISGYAPLLRPLSFEALEISWETAGYEFELFGISLKDLAKAGKKLVFSEHGLGGCYWDFSVAPSLDFMKNHPWLGYWPNPGWTKSTDPWVKPDYKKYRNDFYNTVIRWAQTGGGPQYQIDGIYTWSVGSFDVTNVHPVTTNANGTYSDPAIAAAIRKSNLLINSGALAPRPVYGALKALRRDFKLFSKLADASGVSPVLNATVLRATIFAPTDEAIQALAARFQVTLDQLLSNELLVDRLVAYHIITRANLGSKDLTANKELTPVKGGPIRVAKAAGGGTVLKGVQNSANISGPEVVAANTTIVPIDAVLLPAEVFVTIQDALKFRKVTKPILDLVSRDPVLSKAITNPKTAATVFIPIATAAAPLAAAVAKPGAEVTLAGRKVQLNATTLGTILADHFVGGARILPNAVKDGEKLPTLAKGHSVIVKKVFEAPKVGTIELISDLKGAPPAKVVKFDIIAGASLVNLINGTLLPDIKALTSNATAVPSAKSPAPNKPATPAAASPAPGKPATAPFPAAAATPGTSPAPTAAVAAANTTVAANTTQAPVTAAAASASPAPSPSPAPAAPVAAKATLNATRNATPQNATAANSTAAANLISP